jgi:hypothetical protein
MRFLGLGLEDRVPDARTIWLFREKLTTAGAIKRLFEQFDAMLKQAGYIAMSGQIVDQPGCGAASAQYGRREEGNQAGPDTANWKANRPCCGTRIATRAGRSNSARPNRARMVQCRQSIWQSRSLAIRKCLDRSPFQLHPPMGGHRCGCLWVPSFAPRLARQEQYGERGVGRYRLPIGGQ